jgi:ribose transport system substrate-binding protein
MKIRRSWLLGFSFLAGLLASCGCASEAGPTKLRIAVIPKGTTHEFWKAIHAGAETAAKELGVEIAWKGPQKEDDRDEQIKVVEDFVTRHVDGIVVAPLDDKALARPLEDANSEGIPVIVIDSDVDWPSRVSFIATDNYKGGVMGAEELGRLLGGKGKALMMRYVVGSASTTEREAGFLDTLKAKFPDIEVLSENQYAGAGLDSAQRTSENLLTKFPEVEGIFCPNESALFGMLRALQDSGRAGKVRVVGFDATDKLAAALRAGELDGLIVQNPFAMGDLGVRRMVDHIRGQSVEARIDTGVVLATRENMDRPEIARVLSPDLSILGD